MYCLKGEKAGKTNMNNQISSLIMLHTLKMNFKQNKMVRFLACPAVNAIRLFRLLTYQFTEDARQVRKFKDKYKGQRCFIIGNGPSLQANDLDQLCKEHCFAANRIFYMFQKTDWRPEFYLCADSYVLNDIKDTVRQLELPNIFIHLEGKKLRLCNPYTKIIYINNYYPYLINNHKRISGIRVSSDVSHHFEAGETVTFNAIQFAFYMGFTEIYLLGVDHNYSKKRDHTGKITVDSRVQDYFDGLFNNDYSVQNIETSTAAYKAAAEYAKRHHIKITNLTRGGKLEVFPREDFEKIIKEKVEKKHE